MSRKIIEALISKKKGIEFGCSEGMPVGIVLVEYARGFLEALSRHVLPDSSDEGSSGNVGHVLEAEEPYVQVRRIPVFDGALLLS